MVKQAIVTKYFGPTNTRGARIKATSGGGINVTIPYAHDLSNEAAHSQAAVALCQKLKWWPCKLLQGSLKSGYAFVFADSRMDS